MAEVGSGFVSARVSRSILRSTVPVAQLVMSEVPGVDDTPGDTRDRLTSLGVDDRWRHWRLCSRRRKPRWRRGCRRRRRGGKASRQGRSSSTQISRKPGAFRGELPNGRF